VRLESLREEERARIAREVHDELGGALTAIKMDLSRLARRAAPHGSDLPEALSVTSSLIDNTIQTVRRIATDLRPALLDDFGVLAAIEWQAQEFTRRTGIECVLEFEADELELNDQAATALFRIFQETLTNVARHADATEVRVALAREPASLVLSMRDNGQGFKVDEAARSPSLGLAGMRERVFSVAGELDIQSTPGEGTTVTVTIPFGAQDSSKRSRPSG
jgi:signal transduction histidine kinase